MESNKLDRLFREKSESFKVAPSPDSWEAIAQKIDGKSEAKRVYLKLAASFTLILCATIAWLQYGQRDQMVSVIANHPVPQDALVTWDPANVLTLGIQVVSIAEPAAAPAEREVVEESASDVTATEKPLRLTLALVDRKGIDNYFQLKMPGNLGPTSDIPVISIKYYANLGEEATPNDKKGLSNWVAKASELKPGQLFADLRAAKDDLFASKRGK